MALNEKELQSKYSEENQEWQRIVSEKDDIIDGYRKEHGKLEVFFNKIRDGIIPIDPLPVIYHPGGHKPTSPCVAVMQISDGHMGAVQEPDEIEGFGEFSPDICKERQLKYVQKFLDWVTVHRTSYLIDDLAVLVTGDMISGDIHQELMVTNAFPTPVQVVKASEVLTLQLAMLAPHFNHITVHFIVEDNHSRLTMKPQAKEAGFNSLNYLVGYIGQQNLSKHGNIEFNLYPMYEKVIGVSNRRYLISHGHNVMGWGGYPYYGIHRKIGREASARMQIIMKDVTKAKHIGFDKYVFGHWHTPFDFPLFSCCGSVSGTDAYDHKNGRFAEPSQSSWIVHPKHGEFDRINFCL